MMLHNPVHPISDWTQCIGVILISFFIPFSKKEIVMLHQATVTDQRKKKPCKLYLGIIHGAHATINAPNTC